MSKRWNEDSLETGASPVKTLMVVAVAVVAALVGLKFAGAYMDIRGIQDDLQSLNSDLPLECVGDRLCEEQLVTHIESVRMEHGRDVVLDYESMGYWALEDRFAVDGTRTIDLVLYKYVWPFTVDVQRK